MAFLRFSLHVQKPINVFGSKNPGLRGGVPAMTILSLANHRQPLKPKKLKKSRWHGWHGKKPWLEGPPRKRSHTNFWRGPARFTNCIFWVQPQDSKFLRVGISKFHLTFKTYVSCQVLMTCNWRSMANPTLRLVISDMVRPMPHLQQHQPLKWRLRSLQCALNGWTLAGGVEACYLGGGFKELLCFHVHPYLGKIPILTHMF